MYRCRRQCIIGRQLSDDKWSVWIRTVVSGCDSIVSTTLIVDTVLYSTTFRLCYGDSALFGGVMYDTSGVYEIRYNQHRL